MDVSGATPLHYAARVGHLDACSTLIDHGANPEDVASNGKTPLHYAAEYASTNIVNEDEYEFPEDSATWLHLLEASEEWCQRNKTRPRPFIKRTQSQMLRTNQCWGDFSKMKSKTLELM